MDQAPNERLKSNAELGRELGLYVTSNLVGSGLPLFTPKGAIIKRELEQFILDEERKRGYQHTSTPIMAKSDLYKVSGHWQHYHDSMFSLMINEQEFALRPMTCPFHFMLYTSQPHSYRELPLRYAELATLFRNEQSGELMGLTRLRQFTLSDAHIICTPGQLEEEFTGAVDLIKYTSRVLGLRNTWNRLSTRDDVNKEKFIDNPPAWDHSEKIMRNILSDLGLEFVEGIGEAAFYGPKLDVQINNVFGKEETLLTVQIDFALPDRFKMKYVGTDGNDLTPIVVHRSSIGCIERTMAYILEDTQGKLPTWLSPVQAKIIGITSRNDERIREIAEQLVQQGIRAEADMQDGTLGYKIRQAQLEKIPYVIVIGDREEKSSTLAVRRRQAMKAIENMDLSSLIAEVTTDIRTKGGLI